MGERFEVRAATADDAEEVARTVLEGFDSFREWAGPGYDPPISGHETQRIREGLARPDVWALMALEEGLVAGHVAFLQARERTEPRPVIPGLAHLWQLFVRRAWWGAGLATLLNRLAVTEAAARGYGAMRLLTPFDHARARAFYEREGWSTDGTPVPEPMLGIDLVEYRRKLR